ncbi:MAG: hypothetical protein FD135_3706 [Comamonadaceae bacterium]|nr:MAG: hypothetical protein FD135_3706 [Comamonadaceae bacterium]
MQIHSGFALVDELLSGFASDLGDDFVAYRNHINRVLNVYLALNGQLQPSTAVLVAAAFHDLGIWTQRSFDYLKPSVDLAKNWLASQGLSELEAEVDTIITEHHKLSLYTGAHFASVEAFRQADLVDVSMGLIRFGLPGSYIRLVKQAFPSAGFHRKLLSLTINQFKRSPLRPLPMIHW